MTPRAPLPMGLLLGLGLASGAVEVAVRASPVHGLSAADLALWLACAVGLSSLFLFGVGGLAWGLRRWSHGAPVGALVALHLGLAWRGEVVVNAFLTEPRVWAVLLGILAGGLALAAGLDRWIALHSRGVAWAAAGAGLVFGGLAFVRVEPTPLPPASDRLNVVVVTLDTARADRFGTYGSANATPQLDRIAAQGVLFEEAIATAPLTEPSHLAILSGVPPHQSGLVANGTDLGERPAMLSRVLSERGWATAGFVAGFPLSARFGWDQGFHIFDDDFGVLPGLHRLSLVRAWDQVALPGHTLRERRGEAVLDRALPWLDAHAQRPFFLWVHLFDAHGPYEAPGQIQDAPTDGAPLDLPPYWPARDRAITSADWLISAYEAEIRHVDSLLGRLVEHLDGLGLAERTLLVVTADHGESLTEHGYLFDHGDDLYDPSLRVPLVFRLPGRIATGTRVPCQVSNEDVAPTVLALLEVDDGQRRAGRSRGSELVGGPCAEASVVSTTVGARFTDTPPVDHALRGGGYKLISWADRPDRAAHKALFDLVTDPAETRPVDAPSVLPRYEAALEAALSTGSRPAPAQDDPVTQEALRALGYVE